MDERRRIAVVAALAVVSVAVVGVVVMSPRGTPAFEMPSQDPTSTGGVLPDDRPPVAIRDFVFATTDTPASPTRRTQDGLWFAEGSWWAALLSPTAGRIHIYRLDWGTQTWLDTGTVIDPRPDAAPDVLWDGGSLLVASAGTRHGSASAALVSRFHYDRDVDRFVIDPDFPAQITDGGATAISIDRDGAGTGWATYVRDGTVWVTHTVDGEDAHWSTPTAVPGSSALTGDDVAALTAYGPGRLGLMWTDMASGRVLFASHDDGADEAAWSPVEVVTTGIGPDDDHLSLTSIQRNGGRLPAVALTTSLLDGADPNPLSPRLLVAIRDASGRWDAATGGRVQDHQSRPILLVDETRDALYLVAQAPTPGGGLFLKRASVDNPSFETGLGEPLLTSETDPKIAGAMSTKGAISPATGLVVAAADESTGRYLHAAVDLGGTPVAGSVATLERPDTPDSPDIGPAPVVHDEFDAWPDGASEVGGWTTDVAGGTVAVSVDGETHVLRHATKAAAGSAGSCRDILGAGGGEFGVDLRWRAKATGSGEARLATVRIPGGETAGLRVEADGELSYFDGGRRVRTALRLADGRWYRARLRIDVDRRQWDLRLTADDGKQLLSRTGIDWRTDKAGVPDRVCFRVDGDRATLDIDRVFVTR